MPIYEYRCNECDVEFERIQKASDDNPTCPLCGSAVTKLMSVPGGILMKGPKDSSGTCCGMSNPCASPKGCCGK